MPRRKKEEQPREQIKIIKTPPIVKGMKDVLPNDAKHWTFVENQARRLIHDYSFSRIETPILEKFDLFNHSLFKQNNILEKEAFVFTDRGERLCLRPEATASVVRSYIEHNLSSQQAPLKVYYWGPMFRQGKIESNKLRQFSQVGFEILGDPSPAIDAELIIMAHFLMKNLGIKGDVKLNSVGCTLCRPEYKKVLTEYLKSKRAAIPADLRKLVTKDPLKVFQCNTQRCTKAFEDAPQTVDFLCDDCRNHLFKVLEYLDELKVSYQLDPTLSRTFDFYSKTIFEIVTPVEEGKEPNILAGGGRYDNVVEMLGGEPTPAAGFSFGIERLVSEIRHQQVEIPAPKRPDVFVAQLSESARQKAFSFFEALRSEKLSVKANFSKGALKAQLDLARKLKAKVILILGQKEVTEGTVILREEDSGIQEVISIDKVVLEVKKRIKEINKRKK
jgi:histidyl-tRNA synthetase